MREIAAEESGAGTDPSRRPLIVGLASGEGPSRPAVNRPAELPTLRGADRVATACVAPDPPRESADLVVNEKVPVVRVTEIRGTACPPSRFGLALTAYPTPARRRHLRNART